MNFYEFLGVPAHATESEIKKAFRDKAKKTHPDYNKKNTAFYEMVELNLIHDTLLNPTKRAEYDQALHQGIAGTTIEYSAKKPAAHMRSIFKVMRELFTYRCRICGIEMSSTWQGYCLYHFLEVSGQLNSPDHTFQYQGYTFRWAPPVDETPNRDKTKHSLLPTKFELILFLLTILVVVVILFIYIRYYWLLPAR